MTIRRVGSLATALLAFAHAMRQAPKGDMHYYDGLEPTGRARPNPPQLRQQPDRDVRSPQDFSAGGWWQITKRTIGKFSDNELMAEAAGVTFFALLSLFPGLTALVSVYGLFADPSSIQTHLDVVSGFIPSGGMDIIREQVRHLTESPVGGLSFGAIFGVSAALWSANQGAKAMFSALNDVYGEHEERGFIKKTALSLAFTGGGIAFVLLALGAMVALPMVFQTLGLAGGFDRLAAATRWPILFLGIIVMLALLYRFGPSRNTAKWRWVTWGGAIAAVLWIALSFGFSWYVEHFGSYNKTYGSLGAIIGFMTWIWLSSSVLLLGAQINAEMETQTDRDSTTGAEKPLGLRGAAAADVKSS